MKEEIHNLDLREFVCRFANNSVKTLCTDSLINILHANGIHTIGSLRDISIYDLIKFPRVGARRIEIFVDMKDYLDSNAHVSAAHKYIQETNQRSQL